jgi:GntR family transcriptional regulator, arabinose operon transcriptional repressor
LFVASRYAAFTVDDRERGFREALHERGLPCRPAFLQRMDPENVERMRDLMASQRPDGIVCANDRTAARLMHALQRLGYRIPQQVRLVGIDDVEYAHLLPVPLTTLRQPTQQIGEVAMAAMLQRIERPDLPAREIHLPCELVVRESCGASNHRST